MTRSRTRRDAEFTAFAEQVVDRTSVPAVTGTSASGSVTLQLGTDVIDANGARYTGPASLEVSVDGAERSWSAMAPGARALTQQLPAPGGAAWLVDGDVVAGIVPSTTVHVVPIWSAAGPTYATSLEPVPGTSWSAFALWTAGGVGSSEITGVDLLDGSAVHRADGSEVPSATSEGRTVFVDSESDLFGIVGSGQAMTARISDARAGHRPVLATSTMSRDLSTTQLVMLLPEGVDNVELRAASGTTVRSSEVRRFGPGRPVALVAVLQSAGDPKGTGVEAVTWRNADGSPGSAPGD